MKRIISLCTIFFLFNGIAIGQQTIKKEALNRYYQNPVISGFNPDPSICRVGEDYYLVTSSFEYFPGVPVYHSKDLVNWKLIGHVLNRPSQINLDHAEHSKGIFAATIRYNNGVFYMITTDTGGIGNFVCTATNPAGPWSDPFIIENAPGIDSSLFFESNGKAYYTGNCMPETKVFDKDRNIWVQEIDTKTWKLVGEKVDVLKAADFYNGLILSDKEDTWLNNLEGPHIYKKDDYYYLLLSHGGTSWKHAVSIWRSKNIFGPYEMNPNNPIITHRDYTNDHEIHATGHADVVQTQNNEWWMVLLGVRPYGTESSYNLGRETFLVPMDWAGTWPVVNPLGPIGRVQSTHLRPNLPIREWTKDNSRDEFDTKELRLDWNFIRTPKGNWWALDAKKGQLKINLIPNDITNKTQNPAFIGRRQEHKNFEAVTKMDFDPKASNETAGLVILHDNNYHFRLVATIDAGKKVVQLIRRAEKEGTEKVIGQKEINGSSIYLKIGAIGQMYSFSCSVNGKDWDVVKANESGVILSNKYAFGYTGAYIGMYGSSNGKESKNSAIFQWFEYSGY